MKGKRKLIERINAWFLVILMVISIIPFNVFRIRAKADSQTNGYSITVKDEAGALIDGVNCRHNLRFNCECSNRRNDSNYGYYSYERWIC